MKRSSILLSLFLAVVAGALVAGSTAGDEPPKTVKAKRYRIIFAEGSLELSHGGGRWVDELFLPDDKVVGTLVFDTEVKNPVQGAHVEFESRVRLYARPSDKPRNDLTGLNGPPSKVDDIEIPADLAKEIVALAELTKRQEAETLRLGNKAAEKLGWKEIPRSP